MDTHHEPAETPPPSAAARARLLTDALAAAVVVGAFWLPPALGAGDRSRAGAGIVLAVLAGAAMLLRHRFPAAATAVAGGATVAGTLLGVGEDPMLATAWCLYALAVARAPRSRAVVVALAGLLAGLAAVTAVPPAGGAGRGGDGTAGGAGQRLVVAVAALSVAWLLGTTVGRQVAAARAAERARVQLEVARDVHDVVGHALAVISAEAGVMRGLPGTGAEELRGALAGIETHAREALQEMQALVRTLRHPAPAPGPERLAALIAATRAAGVTVDVRIDTGEPLGEGALRIVQESLSNVLRHAPGAVCTVDIHRDGGTLVVRIRDNGPGAAPDRLDGTAGTGLHGMRERARLGVAGLAARVAAYVLLSLTGYGAAVVARGVAVPLAVLFALPVLGSPVLRQFAPALPRFLPHEAALSLVGLPGADLGPGRGLLVLGGWAVLAGAAARVSIAARDA